MIQFETFREISIFKEKFALVRLPQRANVGLGFITWPNLGLDRLRMRNTFRMDLLCVRHKEHKEGGTHLSTHVCDPLLWCDWLRAFIAVVDGMPLYICMCTTQRRCHTLVLSWCNGVTSHVVLSIRTSFWREFLINLLKINNSNRPGKLWSPN